MQTLEITDEQHAAIQRLRQELSETVVGKYGHVREQDALQYLLDNLDPDADCELELSADELTGAETSHDDLEAISYDESTDTEPSEPDSDRGEAATEPDEDASTGTVDDETDAAADDGDDSRGENSSSGAADDDDMLNQMMNLLDTHDDKWEESSSADYRYSVTLPDGSVEHVQTKDDVRALLFKNY